jgi:hypothetical protein
MAGQSPFGNKGASKMLDNHRKRPVLQKDRITASANTTWTRLGKIAVMAGLLCIVPAVARANQVFNPGFETGDFTGWTVVGSFAIVPCGDINYTPHTGNCAAELGPFTVTLSQDVVTVPGASYTFDFWVASQVSDGSLISFSASWDGSAVLSISNQINPLPYTHESFSLTATGASTLVSFTGQGSNAHQWMLDDVSVTANSPEPGSIALVIMGGGVIAIRLRRRRSGHRTAMPEQADDLVTSA